MKKKAILKIITLTFVFVFIFNSNVFATPNPYPLSLRCEYGNGDLPSECFFMVQIGSGNNKQMKNQPDSGYIPFTTTVPSQSVSTQSLRDVSPTIIPNNKLPNGNRNAVSDFYEYIKKLFSGK